MSPSLRRPSLLVHIGALVVAFGVLFVGWMMDGPQAQLGSWSALAPLHVLGLPWTLLGADRWSAPIDLSSARGATGLALLNFALHTAVLAALDRRRKPRPAAGDRPR